MYDEIANMLSKDRSINSAKSFSEAYDYHSKKKETEELLKRKPIKQNQIIIDKLTEFEIEIKDLKKNTEKPRVTDFIIIILTILTLIFTVLQYLK